MMRSTFERWDDSNPDSPFNVEYFANDAFKERIRTTVGSGNAPTLIFGWGGGTLRDYVAAGSVADLTGHVDGVQSRIGEAINNVGMVDGATYAVANSDTQPEMLYLNNDLLEKAGVSSLETWDDFLGAVEALQSIDVLPISLAASSNWPALLYMQFLTDRFGGPEVFGRILEGEQDAWLDPSIVDAAQAVLDLVEMGAFGDSFGSVSADQSADLALIHTGQAGMLLQGSWVYATFKEDASDFVRDGRLGYAPFPALPGGKGDPRTVAGNPSNYWSVSAEATDEQKEMAYQYLNDFNLDDEALQFLADIGTIPPTLDAVEYFSESEDSEYLEFAFNLANEAPHFEMSWDQALSSGQAQELLSTTSRLFQRQVTAEQFAESMNETL